MSIDSELTKYFGFTFPEEFHHVWAFATEQMPESPDRAFDFTTGVNLVGPFDVMLGRFQKETAQYDPALHWRYFGDPPEFVTLFLGNGDGLHWGYVVEDPKQGPLGLAGYYAYDDVSLFEPPSSLFAFLIDELEQSIEQFHEDVEFFPEMADDEIENKRVQECQRQIDRLVAYCEKHEICQRPAQALSVVDHCNFPAPLPIPDDFSELPRIIDDHLNPLRSNRTEYLQACLRIGRFLWHWHNDGDKIIQQCAYTLLTEAYLATKNEYLHRILNLHNKHRHRPSLDGFEL